MRSISPVIAIVILLLMTVAAGGLAYLTITGFQSTAQTSSEGAVQQLMTQTQSQLKIESVSGGKIYIRNTGTQPISNIVTYLDGVPGNITCPEPMEPDQVYVCELNEEIPSCPTGYVQVQLGSGGASGTMKVRCEQLQFGGGGGPVCGNANCETGETCSNCETDCGTCPLNLPWPMFRRDARNTGYSPEVTSPAQPGVFEGINLNGEIGAGGTSGTPLAGDLDGDGIVEIVIGENEGLRVFYGTNRSLKWMNDSMDTSRFSLADADKDGIVEVIAGNADYLPEPNPGIYSSYGNNGTLKWFYPTSGSSSNILIADVDSDGVVDIVFSDLSCSLTVIRGDNGIFKWSYSGCGFPAAAADLDNDSIVEVVFIGDDTYLHVLYGTNGTEKWNYSTVGEEDVFTSSALADLDEDGDLEVLASSSDNRLYAIYPNGTQMWNYTNTGVPTIADIDNDDKLEVVFSNGAVVYALYGINGTQIWNSSFSSSSLSSPLIGDIDGDGMQDIIMAREDTSDYSDLLVLYSTNGTEHWRSETYIPTAMWCYKIEDSIALADVDKDGVIEILFYSGLWCM